MYNDIIEFGSIKYDRNKYGQEIETVEWREVYAEVMSVSRSEFYSAAMANIRPTYVFAIADKDDYQDEKQIRYNGITYDVIRTYRGRDSYRLELTAEMRERDDNRERMNDGR